MEGVLLSTTYPTNPYVQNAAKNLSRPVMQPKLIQMSNAITNSYIKNKYPKINSNYLKSAYFDFHFNQQKSHLALQPLCHPCFRYLELTLSGSPIGVCSDVFFASSPLRLSDLHFSCSIRIASSIDKRMMVMTDD